MPVTDTQPLACDAAYLIDSPEASSGEHCSAPHRDQCWLQAPRRLHGVRAWQRSAVAASALHSWCTWMTTFSNACLEQFAQTAFRLAVHGCPWAQAEAATLLRVRGPAAGQNLGACLAARFLHLLASPISFIRNAPMPLQLACMHVKCSTSDAAGHRQLALPERAAFGISLQAESPVPVFCRRS